MKLRDAKLKKFVAEIINFGDEIDIYTIDDNPYTRYESIFMVGKTGGKDFFIELIRYKMIPAELILKETSNHNEHILVLWDKCTSGQLF